MAVNYSTSTNYSGQNYVIPQKTPTQKAVKGAVVGAASAGIASLGYQKFVMSNLSDKFVLWISRMTAADLRNEKKGMWYKILTNIEETINRKKVDWSKVGNAALIGGAAVGIISAIKATHKQNKAMQEMQGNGFGYYA